MMPPMNASPIAPSVVTPEAAVMLHRNAASHLTGDHYADVNSYDSFIRQLQQPMQVPSAASPSRIRPLQSSIWKPSGVAVTS